MRTSELGQQRYGHANTHLEQQDLQLKCKDCPIRWFGNLAVHQRHRPIQVNINRCLRQILGIRWREKLSNIELWRRTGQQPIAKTIRERKWRWIGHTLHERPNQHTGLEIQLSYSLAIRASKNIIC